MTNEKKMRITLPQIHVEENEGFDPKKDIFGRATLGKGLTNLVRLSADPLVIMLDAPWGTGKSTFVQMWAGQLRNEKFPVIYFDAFQNDHVENGFIAIAAEIVRLADNLKKTKTKVHVEFLKKASRAGGVLLRTGAKIGVKAATLGAIDAADLSSLKGVAADIAAATSTKADEYVETLLKLQSHERETLKSVRDSLTEVAKSFSAHLNDGKLEECPLIFIVDELDRCKPSFALEILEKIKHIFSTPNVHFILVADTKQLEASVRYTYGNEIDGRAYLQKFYNISTFLPDRADFRGDRVIPRYLNYLRETFSLNSDHISMLSNVAEARDLSLRTVERIASCVALAVAVTPANYMWIDPIIGGLSVMKVLDPELFRRARKGAASIDEVSKLLAFSKWPSDSRDSAEWNFHWWIYCLAERQEDYPDVQWDSFRQHLFRYSIRDRKDIIRFMADHIERFSLPS